MKKNTPVKTISNSSKKNPLNDLAKLIFNNLKKIPGIIIEKPSLSNFKVKSVNYNGVKLSEIKGEKNHYCCTVAIKLKLESNYTNIFKSVVERIKFLAQQEFDITITKVDIIVNKINL